MNKHTPTPWHVDKIIRTMVRDATKLIVCRCESSYSADDDIRIANTEYIVKCVNLISELEQKGITAEQLEKLISGEACIAEWLPISTAPRDGTKILVHDTGCISKVHYSDNACFGNFEYRKGWVEFDCSYDDFYSTALELDEPTRWMELPNPPKENE